MFLNLDENNYLLSIASVGKGIKADIDLSEYDLSGNRINAHKWENGVLVFDEEHYVEIEEKNAEMTSQPTAQDDTDAMLIDHEYKLTMLELGVSE